MRHSTKNRVFLGANELLVNLDNCTCVSFSDRLVFVFTWTQHDHYLQVVKTEVITLHRKQSERIVEQYDYTAHSNLIQATSVPVVKFHYELSPMQVRQQYYSLDVTGDPFLAMSMPYC